MSTQLIKYDAAVRALAECKAVDEVKDWHDKAAAMQAYGRIAKDKTLETDAAEIRIHAERRLGQMLASAEKNKGGRPIEITGSEKAPVSSPTLADSGIDKKLSARAQKLAAVPEAQFAAAVGEWRERVTQEGARVTANLEAAGAKFMAAKPAAKATPTTKATPLEASAPSAEAEHTEPTEIELLREQLSDYENLVADNEQLRRVVESNDVAKGAFAEAVRFAELARVLQERVNGLMNEKNEYIKAAKRWQRKCEALEKQIKETAEAEF